MSPPKFRPLCSIIIYICAGVIFYISYFMSFAWNEITGNNSNPTITAASSAGIVVAMAIATGIMEYSLHIQLIEEYKELDEMFERYPS